MAGDPATQERRRRGAKPCKLSGEDFNLFRGVFNGLGLRLPRGSARAAQVAAIQARPNAAERRRHRCRRRRGCVDERFLRVPITGERRDDLIEFCDQDSWAAPKVDYTNCYTLEKELREVLHLILSAPEYQLS